MLINLYFMLTKLVKYSSRFATRTARTHGIGQRGKKRVYLAQPKADMGSNATWSCMGIAPKLSKLGPVVMLGWSWAQIDTDSPRISDAHGHPGHVQHCATSDPLALASHQVGPKVRTTWGRLLNTKNAENSSHVGPKRRIGRIGTMLGWSAQCAYYHSPVHFLAAAILKMAPPPLKLYQTDRSVHSSRPNYHASAP